MMIGPLRPRHAEVVHPNPIAPVFGAWVAKEYKTTPSAGRTKNGTMSRNARYRFSRANASRRRLRRRGHAGASVGESAVSTDQALASVCDRNDGAGIDWRHADGRA